MCKFTDALRARAAATPAPSRATYPQGIVVVAGGELYARLAFHLITVLRGLGCRLPIELWHFPHEMPQHIRCVFDAEPDVTLVDVSAYCRDHNIHPRPVPDRSAQHCGWWLKAFAVTHSRFAEVMLIDADNVPVVDPTYLFNDHRYQRPGAMFWPDLPPGRERGQWVPEGAWRAVGLEPAPMARPFESGQLLVDRRRHAKALDITLFLNDWSDEVYRFVYGDKDTFLLGWHLAGAAYHVPPKNPVWRHPAICQHDSDGRLVFQHACQGKSAIAAGDVVKSILNRRFSPDAKAEFDRRSASAA